MEKIRPRITDFKNDLVFKFMLSDLNDSHCYYLLKVIIEGITGIKCQELFVLNSEVNPEHLSDKDMVLDVWVKTDEGKLIDIEMPNSALTKEVHYRFQIYGARIQSFLEKSIIVFKLMNLACLIIKSIEEISYTVRMSMKSIPFSLSMILTETIFSWSIPTCHVIN